jgi:hypothetical protein
VDILAGFGDFWSKIPADLGSSPGKSVIFLEWHCHRMNKLAEISPVQTKTEEMKRMGKFKAAFMFVTPDSDPKIHRTSLSTPEVLDLVIVGVRDYDQAAQVARELVDQGVTAIELCGAFGQIGVARVAEAVGDRAFVGVIRFDRHPGLGYKSGDELFVK